MRTWRIPVPIQYLHAIGEVRANDGGPVVDRAGGRLISATRNSCRLSREVICKEELSQKAVEEDPIVAVGWVNVRFGAERKPIQRRIFATTHLIGLITQNAYLRPIFSYPISLNAARLQLESTEFPNPILAAKFMTPYFFGETQQQLFGALHPALASKSEAHRTVVICPPIGQEYIRSHWCLRLLARQISRKGINVLRLDYRGIGDSAGVNEETTSIKQWHQDVHNAIEFACEKTDSRNVMLIGLRYGGAIASAVAAETSKVNSLILWEPVLDAAAYLQSLRAMHKQMIDLWVCKIKTPNDSDREEILGSIYSRKLLQELENTTVDLDTIDQPQFIVDLFEQRSAYNVNKMQRFMPAEDENSWTNLQLIETGWLRAATARQITLMTDEMFSRLQEFNQLGAKQNSVASRAPVLASGDDVISTSTTSTPTL